MAIDLILFTKEGFDFLQAELLQLKSIERLKVIKEIAEARSHGDLSENAEYSAAREKQGFIEGRINELEGQLSRADVLDFSLDPTAREQVRFGARVTVEDLVSGEKKTLRVVGDLEADIKVNKISVSSPIALALLGKKRDDIVEVQAPKGVLEYAITDIQY
ncbi:MAG: transcription elongation factor GreA [Proteobacteria bacterium]|nr:transcription elongation factor GreA [Pseudomonadota bacterium]